MERATRIRLIEAAAAELLESETNAALRIGARGVPSAGLVIKAAGCSVVVEVERGGSVLLAVAALQGGPTSLAAGCERTLRTVHSLSDAFVPTVTFANPTNASGFQRRLR
jgi:D-serine deaminase-like pyridoxal phosphate-dependent protein